MIVVVCEEVGYSEDEAVYECCLPDVQLCENKPVGELERQVDDWLICMGCGHGGACTS